MQFDEVEGIVRSWFVWKSAVRYLEQDAKVIMDSSVRLPMGYGQLLDFFQRCAKSMVEASFRQMRKRDVRVLGEKTDGKELFIMWKHRGETNLLRFHDNSLRLEVQKKFNEVVRKKLENENNKDISLL